MGDGPRQPAKPTSPGRILMGRLIRNRSAMIGAIILFVLYLAAIFGSFLGPYDPTLSNTEYPDHPPTTMHFRDEKGSLTWPPYIHASVLRDNLRRVYGEDTTRKFPVRFLVKGEPYKLWWMFDCKTHLFGLGDPVQVEFSDKAPEADVSAGPPPPDSSIRLYLFGSDRLGRDILSRVLAGAKISLSVGLIGIAITMVLGLLVGGLSGYAGGAIDALIMRFVELLMSIPGLYLILALRAALSEVNPLFNLVFGLKEGEPMSSGQVYVLIIGILALVSWGGTARVIRGMVLSIKELDYVAAARAMGASPLRIIVHHLLPNTFTYVIIAATISIPYYILGEVGLSYLGVGIDEPQASWGLMLNEAQSVQAIVAFPWLLISGVFIFITVFAFNFLGDGLRDALDPKYLK